MDPDPFDPERFVPNTSALRYSLWERLVFKVTGRWPDAVVQRRLDAHDADMELAHERAKR